MTNQSDNSVPQQADSTKEPHTALMLNYSTSLTVRVGLSSLGESVAQTLRAHALRFLSQPTGDVNIFAGTALRRARFIESPATRSFGITESSDEWLLDDSGHHLLEALERDFNRRGVNSAQRTLESWQVGNQERASDRAETKVREMLADLDAVKTLRDHADSLDEVIMRLQRTQSTIESSVGVVNENYRRLTEYLQNNSTTQTPSAAPSTTRKRRSIARGYHRVMGYFGYGKGEENAPASAPRNNFARLELDMLYAQLQLAALAAERAVAAEMVELLRQERATDEELLTLFSNAEGEASRAARRMEESRDYGLAAGELLLNDESLTTATVNYLYGNNEEASFAVLNRFVESGQAETIIGRIANLRTDEVNSFVSELLTSCHALVAEKLNQFTIADALAALLSDTQTDWHAKLDAAFKATVTTDFLASSYAKYLDPQIFAAVTYAPSKSPQNNECLSAALESIRHSTHIDFDIKPDGASRDQLLFYCEYFCLPLESFRFYEDGWKDFEQVKDQPRYNPHPDIYRQN